MIRVTVEMLPGGLDLGAENEILECKRDMGFIGACGCPRCVEKNNTRAKKTRG